MMKYAIALLFSVSVLNAQTGVDQMAKDVEVGDIFEIGKPETSKYKHIDFPRANFIMKRGGIANYKSVLGEEVVVTSIKERKDGTVQVKFKRNDGGRFFGSHKFIAADVKGALESGELQAL